MNELTIPTASAKDVTKRELFAAMAMQAVKEKASFFAGTDKNGNVRYVAKLAVSMADALIEELNKTENSLNL